jgi:F0F1-type ATP synthase assembly protein I
LDKKQRKKSANTYLKYSGLAFQLAATIGVGAFIGYKLDERMGNDKMYMTALFVIIFAFAGLYLALKDIL